MIQTSSIRNCNEFRYLKLKVSIKKLKFEVAISAVGGRNIFLGKI